MWKHLDDKILKNHVISNPGNPKDMHVRGLLHDMLRTIWSVVSFEMVNLFYEKALEILSPICIEDWTELKVVVLMET